MAASVLSPACVLGPAAEVAAQTIDGGGCHVDLLSEFRSFRHRVGLWASRAGLAIWKATLGYGYRPRRALAWLLALLIIAGLVVTFATHWQPTPAPPIARSHIAPRTQIAAVASSIAASARLPVSPSGSPSPW